MKSSEIANVSFSTTKFREGYSMPEVDSFLDKIRRSLAAWESGQAGVLTAEEIEAARFSLTKFRAGYDEEQVDNFLDQAMVALSSFENDPEP